MKLIATFLLSLSGYLGVADLSRTEPPSPPLGTNVGAHQLTTNDLGLFGPSLPELMRAKIDAAPLEVATLHQQNDTAAQLVKGSKSSRSTRYNIPSDPEQRCPKWEPVFQQMGLVPVEVFSYVAYRESRCNPNAQNATWDKNGNMTYHLNRDKSYDTGLLQINSSWFSRVKEVCGEDAVKNRMQGLKDPTCNIKFAKWIMDNSKGKLGNWRVYKK
jgi:hypothetical protein